MKKIIFIFLAILAVGSFLGIKNAYALCNPIGGQNYTGESPKIESVDMSLSGYTLTVKVTGIFGRSCNGGIPSDWDGTLSISSNAFSSNFSHYYSKSDGAPVSGTETRDFYISSGSGAWGTTVTVRIDLDSTYGPTDASTTRQVALPVAHSGHLTDITGNNSSLQRTFSVDNGTLRCPFVMDENPYSPDPSNVGLGVKIDNLKVDGINLSPSSAQIQYNPSGDETIIVTLPSGLSNGSHSINGTRIAAFDCAGTGHYGGFFTTPGNFIYTQASLPTLTCTLGADHSDVLYNNTFSLIWSSNGDSVTGTGFDTSGKKTNDSAIITAPTSGSSITYSITCNRGSEYATASKTVNLHKNILNVDAHLLPNGCATTPVNDIGGLASKVSVTYTQTGSAGATKDYSVAPGIYNPWGKVNFSITPKGATINDPTYAYCRVGGGGNYTDPYNQQTLTIYAEFAPVGVGQPSSAPSCTASFSPSSKSSAGGTTSFNITSQNAVSPATYSCKNLSDNPIGGGSVTLGSDGKGSVSLAADQTKTCKVTVQNSAGTLNYCQDQFTLPPSAPTGVSGSASCSGSDPRVSISWSAVLGADSYKLYRVGGGFLGVTDKLVGSTSGTGLSETGLGLGETYKYYVVAVNSAGDSPPSSQVSVITPAACTPGAVTATLTPASQTIVRGTSGTLTWGSSGATSCSGTGFPTGNATSGSVSVSPLDTTNYSVTCTKGIQSASASAVVNVTAPGNSNSVDLKINGKDDLTGANKIFVPYGGSASLNIAWTSSGVSLCSAVSPMEGNNAIGGFSWGNSFVSILSLLSGSHPDTAASSNVVKNKIYNFKIKCQ